jgi:hypothetical protein
MYMAPDKRLKQNYIYQLMRYNGLLYITASLFLFFSCNDQEKKEDAPSIKPKEVFTLKNSGWDIYSGDGYRYGPTIIINDDGSIDAWFAAVGDAYGEWRYLFEKTGNNSPVAVTTHGSVGQRFSADVPFWGVKVVSPNWNGQPCGLTFRLYRWDDSNMGYDEVVMQNPVATATFVDYADGEKIGVTSDDKFPAGTYLWELSDALTQHSGVWLREGAVTGVVSYQGGMPVAGNRNWEAMWAEKKTSGEIFWDQASYQHSTDNGKTWTEEIMSLLPTEFSSDHYSVCDPGAAYWNGYYYIGYTSTENIAMTQNNVYIARSMHPEGPWEKWEGDRWGDDPQPVIRYDGDPTKFGAGEPSIVVVDDTIYFYYSWNDEGTTTRVATAPSDDPNWPSQLTYRGVAIDKSTIAGADHADVKYREETGKFQAIHTADRMSEKGYLVLWQSDNGIDFQKIGEVKDHLMPGIHNCGWSGDGRGHIKKDVPQFLAYAYGVGSWGKWKTRWAEIEW